MVYFTSNYLHPSNEHCRVVFSGCPSGQEDKNRNIPATLHHMTCWAYTGQCSASRASIDQCGPLSLCLPAKHKTLPTLNLAGLRPCRLLVSPHCCLGPASMLKHEDSDSHRTTVSSPFFPEPAHLHSPISHIHKYFENTTFCRYLQDRSTI